MDKALAEFGDLFIKSIRDNTLFVLEGIISGHMKSTVDKEMHDKISQMSEKDIELLKDVAYRMVDLTLHNTLSMFESSQSWSISNIELNVPNLNALSDGLAGELYTSDGWINRFSNYKPSVGL